MSEALTDEQTLVLLECVAHEDPEMIEGDIHEFRGFEDGNGNDVGFDMSLTKLAENCAAYIKKINQENEQLKARVAELEDAIEFATAPDMWVETGDNNVYEYKYFDWYVNVLSEALEKTAKQSLVELQVNEAEKISSIVQECAHNPNRQYMANLVVDDDLTALDIYKAAIIDSMKAIFDYQTQLQAEGE